MMYVVVVVVFTLKAVPYLPGRHRWLRTGQSNSALLRYCMMYVVVVVVVVFTLKAVPISTQYFLTSVLVQLTRTPSVVTGYNYPERVHSISERKKRTQKKVNTHAIIGKCLFLVEF